MARPMKTPKHDGKRVLFAQKGQVLVRLTDGELLQIEQSRGFCPLLWLIEPLPIIFAL